MNKEYKLALLKSWQKVSKSFIEAVSDYMDLTHCSGDAPHIKTAYDVFEEHTKLVAELLGFPFEELLSWAYDLGFGEVAAYDVRMDGKWHSARTIEELFFLFVALTKD